MPKTDRPQWTIIEELLAGSATSRIGEAALAQPLSTAVQIVLVNLLRSAGIKISAVVGHSSGEMAAAYAAGLISASDAIRIAYYRGLFAKLASGPEGQRGAMLAVGTSFEDAKDFCALEDFEGRLVVAACNSSTSVTISGDADAIGEAKAIFEEEKKFARIVKVDKAYHSHHMRASSGPFMEALRACDIQILHPVEGAPTWFSSVHIGLQIEWSENLKAQYWVENLNQPVLFSQALGSALKAYGPLTMALEIGPHPALKGPVAETIQQVTGGTIPYVGTLNRGKNDIESFSDTLGSVWTTGGASAVNFAQFQEIFYDNAEGISLLKNLPTYPWNHDRILWVESRSTRLLRTQDGCFHDLLGIRASDGTDEEWRWQNVLKPKELPWLSDHALQGQAVFPGMGYIALAMEASMQIAGRHSVKFMELCDLYIRKAIAIDDTDGTEILVAMTDIRRNEQEHELICANFTCYSTVSKDSANLAMSSCGNVRIGLGEPSADLLSPGAPSVPGMSSVDIEQFYTAVANLGYIYGDTFKRLSTLRRRLGVSSGTIIRLPDESTSTPLPFHPGMLDTALQGVLAAFSSPGDGRLWSFHLSLPPAWGRIENLG